MQKKLLSLFLSALILLSCVSVGLIAFAEEAQPEVPAATEAVDSAEADASVEMLEEYLELAEQEDEMTKAQREKFADVKAFLTDSFDTLTSEETVAKVKQMLADVTDTAVTALKGGPVGAFEESVNAYEGKLNTATPSDEDLAAYEALVTAYNKLTDAQKGEIEVLTFDKFFHLVLDREYYKERAKYEKPVMKTCYVAAQANAIALLGNAGYVASFEEAMTLAQAIDNSKLSAQEKIDAFGAASVNARVYAAAYYKSYGILYNKLSGSYIKTAVQNLMSAYAKEADKADPFTEKSPAKVTKPNEKNYDGGKEDPQYIADFAAYMENQMAIAEYNCRKANHTTNHEIEGLDKVTAVAPEYAPIAKLMKDSLAAVDAFNASSANLAPAKKVVADFEKLNAYQQKFIMDGGIVLRTVPNPYASSVSTSKKNAGALYQQCADIAQYDRFTAFLAVIDSITEPYTNEDIVRAKDAYNEVPSSLRANIPEEVNAKYKAILASIAPDRPSLDEPDLAVFKKTVVTYPEKATKEQVATALPRIQNLLCDVLLPLLGVEGGLTGLVQNGIYTNYTVSALCKLLFPMLGSLADMDEVPSIAKGMLRISPTDLAKKLQEPEDAGKFAVAVAALLACDANDSVENWDKLGTYEVKLKPNGEPELDNNGKEIYVYDARIPNGAFGFQDGDREGFLDAVSAVFRAVSVITLVLSFENNISTTNGTYTYNAYEDLVPIFEALDLRGYMSSHEYTMYVQEAKNKNGSIAMDARIRPILVPIFNLIDDFAAAPLDTLLDVLPKLSYALESGLVQTQVDTLISKLGFGLSGTVANVLPPLNAEGIFDLVAPMLKDIVVREAGVNEETGEEITEVKISINLDKAKFLQMMKDMSGCGDAVVKNSKARGTAYRLGINSDKPDAFVVLFRWLYGEITTKDNMRAIKSVIDSTDLNSVVKMLIKTVLNRVAETPTDDALVALVNLAAPKAPEIKIPGEIGDLFPNKDKDNDKDNNVNNGTQQTGNPSIPKTGGSVMTICFSLAATAALAGGAMLAKKKSEEE